MEKRTFRAMVVSETADRTFSREITSRSVDDLPPGDVLIKVEYSSLNYKDALSAVGNRGVTRNYPHTPGVDAAGVVEESSVEALSPGDEVIVTGYDLGMNTPGGFGEYIRVPAAWVVKRPQNLTLKESMIYGTAGFTAALSVLKLTGNGVTADQGEVLVTGAPGGVGSIALSILAKSGFQVVAVNGVVDRTEYLLGLGAKAVLSVEEAVDKSTRPLLKGRWAGVIDTLGGDLLSTAIRSTAYGGTITSCGNAASPDLPLTVYPFILRGVSLLGIDSVNCPIGIRMEIWRRLSHEWKLDQLDRIASEISLAALEERIELILQGKHTGRAVVAVTK
ncbi:MAG: YhdH/YhfP family quinone oxidoreductase [Thermodesulfobacteriota bacterium]